jgi:hypothetical protein
MLLIDPLGKGVGACCGDSGSPVFEIKNEDAKVIGVVSFAGVPTKPKDAEASPVQHHWLRIVHGLRGRSGSWNSRN